VLRETTSKALSWLLLAEKGRGQPRTVLVRISGKAAEYMCYPLHFDREDIVAVLGGGGQGGRGRWKVVQKGSGPSP
jgi:hypothetical protein